MKKLILLIALIGIVLLSSCVAQQRGTCATYDGNFGGMPYNHGKKF